MSIEAAAALNSTCLCVGVSNSDIYRVLEESGLPGPGHRLAESHPCLFSSQAVFVARQDAAAMQAVIDAVENLLALPACRDAALADAPALAALLPERPAVLHGFDFHITDAGPRLIEINTNAGGVMLAAAAARALDVQCREPNDPGGESIEHRLWRMFRNVWRHARGARPLTHVAIVDDAPRAQYLYPELLLFQALLGRHGVAVTIADPAELEFRGGAVRTGGETVDLVYNRLTDFYLEAPNHRVLRDAALADAVVLTPDPRAHALYANKRNLARWTDPETLQSWGAAPAVIDALQRYVPRTEIVRADAAERLWANRRHLFFKPARGFGSRGSYRGDKLTRSRFAELLNGDYVAQALVPPGVRLHREGESPPLRYDVRSYVYRGRTLMQTARVYQGQTTNFRTVGGGFAPVVHPPSDPRACSGSAAA